jgi:ribosomal protein L37AE/L43A
MSGDTYICDSCGEEVDQIVYEAGIGWICKGCAEEHIALEEGDDPDDAA